MLMMEKHTCESCGKEFCSNKALHGHMRSHPERPWRGMQPPPTLATTRRSSAAGFPVVDCSTSLPCWTVTARRGRKGTPSASSSSGVSGGEEKIHEELAVHDLISLSKTDQNSAANSDDLNRNKRNFDDPKLQTDQPKNLVPTKKLESAEEQQLNCEGDQMGRKKKIIRVKKIEHIGELNQLSDHQIYLNPMKKYRCDSCNKAFLSHQALGGHKSSHNKTKKTPPPTNKPQQQLNGGSARHPLVGILNMTIITCSSIGTTTVEPQTTPSPSPSLHSTQKSMLDFDLNELPPPMDDGEEGTD